MKCRGLVDTYFLGIALLRRYETCQVRQQTFWAGKSLDWRTCQVLEISIYRYNRLRLYFAC